MAESRGTALQDSLTNDSNWIAFRDAITSVLSQWTVLELALENDWGSGDSDEVVLGLLDDLLENFAERWTTRERAYPVPNNVAIYF